LGKSPYKSPLDCEKSAEFTKIAVRSVEAPETVSLVEVLEMAHQVRWREVAERNGS